MTPIAPAQQVAFFNALSPEDHMSLQRSGYHPSHPANTEAVMDIHSVTASETSPLSATLQQAHQQQQAMLARGGGPDALSHVGSRSYGDNRMQGVGYGSQEAFSESYSREQSHPRGSYVFEPSLSAGGGNVTHVDLSHNLTGQPTNPLQSYFQSPPSAIMPTVEGARDFSYHTSSRQPSQSLPRNKIHPPPRSEAGSTELQVSPVEQRAHHHRHDQPNVVGQEGMPAPAPQPLGPKRRFTTDDDALLIKLKEEKNLTWKQIGDFFPGRNSGTLQVRYSTKLKTKTTVWTDDMVHRLHHAMQDYEKDRWRIIASKLGPGFSATACREKAEELEVLENVGADELAEAQQDAAPAA